MLLLLLNFSMFQWAQRINSKQEELDSTASAKR